MKNVQKVALTGGVIWGLTLFGTTLANVYFGGYGTAFLNVWTSIYPGFTISVTGSFVGLIYGFVDMYFGIYLINWVYKKLNK